MDNRHEIKSQNCRKPRAAAVDDDTPASIGGCKSTSDTTMDAAPTTGSNSTSSSATNLMNRKANCYLVRNASHNQRNPSGGRNLNESSSPLLVKNNERTTTNESKKLDRILANRRSARRSRERRKQLQDNLEKSVFLLTKQNEVLCRENKQLKEELNVLLDLFQKTSLEVFGGAGVLGGGVAAGTPSMDFNVPLHLATAAAIGPAPGACLPSENHNLPSSSLQELLLYMAAARSNNSQASSRAAPPMLHLQSAPVAATDPMSVMSSAMNIPTNAVSDHFQVPIGQGFPRGLGGVSNFTTTTTGVDSTNFVLQSGNNIDPYFSLYNNNYMNNNNSNHNNHNYSSSNHNIYMNAVMDSSHMGQQTHARIFNGAEDTRRF